MVHSIYLFLLGLVLVGWMSLESCPFLLGCQTLLAYNCSLSILIFFFFLDLFGICWNFSFFVSYFVYLRYFSPLLGECCQGLSIVFTLSKNQLLVLLIFSTVFRSSILLIFSLIFITAFSLLTLGFVCSFYNSFRDGLLV